MPSSMLLKANPNLRESDRAQVARRLALIVSGFEDTHETHPGQGWELGRSNDWWLTFDPAQKTFKLTYRYSLDVYEGHIKQSLIFLLGWQEWNPLPEGDIV